jgi:hypothetical protein
MVGHAFGRSVTRLAGPDLRVQLLLLRQKPEPRSGLVKSPE